MAILYIAAAFFLGSTLAAPQLRASHAPPPTQSPVEIFNAHIKHEVHNLFHSFDYNHNGDFDHEDLHLFLQHYDTDGNGTVERAEYELNFDMQEPTLAIAANGMFVEFDQDQSEHIDMQDMMHLYNRMNLNKDGNTQRNEFEEYMTEVMTIIVILQLQSQEIQ